MWKLWSLLDIVPRLAVIAYCLMPVELVCCPYFVHCLVLSKATEGKQVPWSSCLHRGAISLSPGKHKPTKAVDKLLAKFTTCFKAH